MLLLCSSQCQYHFLTLLIVEARQNNSRRERDDDVYTYSINVFMFFESLMDSTSLLIAEPFSIYLTLFACLSLSMSVMESYKNHLYIEYVYASSSLSRMRFF